MPFISPETIAIREVESDADIERCYAVMVQLRPHVPEDEFVMRVQRMRKEGYRLALAEHAGEVCALAGFRIFEMLARGRFMYVDDLITDSAKRSHGFGDALFDWLVVRAQEEGCELLDLDSGVHRFDAHRFYFRKRMHIGAYNFTLNF